ncbi:hypothetical protein D9M68_528540 [compost metagenome]
MMRPSTVTPKIGSEKGRKAGRNICGTLKFKPSSPPVRSDSCETSVWNAAATASVIMA